MAEGFAQSENDYPEHTLRALAYELKNPLTTIARRAELGGKDAGSDIIEIAEHSLALIDSYLLTAQTEYGQAAFELEPMGLGSIMHDVSSQLLPRKQSIGQIIIDNRTSKPVMSHRPALSSALVSIADVMADINADGAKSSRQLILRSYESRSGRVGIGVFNDRPLNKLDIRRALLLKGKVRMPLSKGSSRAGVSLAIAESLCRAIGGNLEVKRLGSLNGLATVLPKSEQLSLV